jgi:hypothetical protein
MRLNYLAALFLGSFVVAQSKYPILIPRYYTIADLVFLSR